MKLRRQAFPTKTPGGPLVGNRQRGWEIGAPAIVPRITGHGRVALWADCVHGSSSVYSLGNDSRPKSNLSRVDQTVPAAAVLCIITGKRWWSHGYIYDENDVTDPPVLYRFKLLRKPGRVVEWVPRLIHNASGVGTQIVAKDINQDGKLELLTTARKGTFIFLDQNGKG
jgi:hypothetical protein